MVSVDPAWNILTFASQNMDEEMSKLLAVKIIQTFKLTQLMKMQSETENQSSSSLSITVRCFISSGQFRIKNWKLLLAYALVRVSCVCSLKKNSVDKKWSSSVAGRVFTLSFVIPLPYNEWRRVFRSVAIFLFVFAFFFFLLLYKIVLTFADA